MAGILLIGELESIRVVDADSGALIAGGGYIGPYRSYSHVHIDRTDPTRMLAMMRWVTSQLGLLKSDDGGSTWSLVSALPSETTGNYPRGIWRKGADIFWWDNRGVGWSSAYLDAGAMTGLSSDSLPTYGGGKLWVKDVWVQNASRITLLANGDPNTSPNFGTANMVIWQGLVTGSTVAWNASPLFTDADIPGWQAEERPRRLKVNDQGTIWYLLTTHGLYKKVGAFPWVNLWPTMRADVAGDVTLTAATDAETYGELAPFDSFDVDFNTGGVWLSGPGGLYAYSLTGATFLVNTPACGVDVIGPANGYDSLSGSTYARVVQEGGYVYRGINRYTSGNACPDSAVWASNDDGATFVLFQDYQPFIETGLVPRSLDVFRGQTLVEGCSSPDACNYDALTQYDDGSCQFVSEVRNCEDLTMMHIANADLAYLQPRDGAFQFGYAMFPGVTTASINISINGLTLFAGSFTIDNSTIQTQMDDFTAQVIAAFNAAGLGWRAVRTPAAYNTIGAAQPTLITFICNTAASNGATVQITGMNITPNFQPTVDNGQSSATVKLVGVNGCWTVIGPGDCNASVPGVIETTYEDCFRCVPYQPPMVCRDCDSMVTIDSTPIASSFKEETATCVVAGQTVQIGLLIGFPVREQQNLVPLQVGTTCSPSCPITYTFTGDQTLLFQVGSTFQVNPSANVYTVASSSYDSNADLTTVVTVEDCAEGVPVVSVDTNTGCVCNAVVTVTDLISNTVVGAAAYPCVDGYISNNYSWVIPQEGRYLITISASYCGEERTCTYYLKACGEYIFREADCHKFDITIQRAQIPNPAPTHTIVIEDMADGQELVNTTVSETLLPYRFTSPGDGVYKVTLTNTLSDTEVVGYIFDLCDTRTCREKLVKDLFCSCDDPCASAGCAETPERDDKRYLIQRVMLMWSELEAAVFTYRFQYLGIPTHTAERDVKIQDIALLVDKIRDVAATCGVCNDGDTKSDCTSC